MIINKENYSEFIKEERELQIVLFMEDEPKIVSQRSSVLKSYLELSVKLGNIKSFTIDENRFEINTPRYFIYLLILHNGDVCQYTINKKVKKRGNYSRKVYIEAVLNTLNNFF